jgi:hypothetical protein
MPRLEFDPATNTGKIKSLDDGSVYPVDSRGLITLKIDLGKGDKVLFATFEDPEGKDHARVIRVIELKNQTYLLSSRLRNIFAL